MTPDAVTLGLIGGLTNDGALWFSAPALAGTLYFVISLVLGGVGGDVDVDLDGEVDITAGDVGGDARFLSLQTISAFALGAGWMGLAAYRLTDLSFSGAVVVALITGLGIAWLLVTLLKGLYKLQSSGNVSIASAVGLTGEVYIAVPPADGGRGRVKLVVDGRRRVFDATQAGREPIASKTMVRVSGVDATTNTISVERIGEDA